MLRLWNICMRRESKYFRATCMNKNFINYLIINQGIKKGYIYL